MIDAQRVQQLELSTRETFDELKATVSELALFRSRREAFELLAALEQRLRYLSRDELGPLAFEYEEIMTTLKFIAFSDLAEADAIRLIREHVADIYLTELDLDDQIRQRLVLIPQPDRDEFKKKIRDAMLANTQILTKKSLVLGADNKATPPTVANWIRDYTSNIGSALATPLQVSQYFSHSSNITALSPDDRAKVVAFLKVYERLKFPSDVVEGLDTPLTMTIDGKLYLVIDGQVVAIGDPMKVRLPSRTPEGSIAVPGSRSTPKALPSVGDLESLVRQVNTEHAVEDETRYAEEEQLLESVGTDNDQMIEVMTSALAINDHEKLLTAVSILARSGAVDRALNQKALRDAFMQEFLKPMVEAQGLRLDIVTSYLDAQQSNSMYTAAFIRWALDRSLHGNESESARIGNRLENTLAALGQTDVVGMTYFDVTLGMFRWTPIVINPDGSLSWIE